MQNKRSVHSAFMVKTILIFSCIVISSGVFSKCTGQAIVGKWKGVSAKYFYSPEYAKQIGKPMEEKTTKEVGDSWGEYKSDHTFTISYSSPKSSQIATMSGLWSVTGNQLKLTLEKQFNPKQITTIATFSINGNTMTQTAEMPPPSRIIKTISTSTRM